MLPKQPMKRPVKNHINTAAKSCHFSLRNKQKRHPYIVLVDEDIKIHRLSRWIFLCALKAILLAAS